mmetsp:Transcript_18528/g.22804  ORF Transcript_18528/g.22804 Transcript_18528/m.22804 type:complete len:401 (+) Transcript_18528:40-1242(+)
MTCSFNNKNDCININETNLECIWCDKWNECYNSMTIYDDIIKPWEGFSYFCHTLQMICFLIVSYYFIRYMYKILFPHKLSQELQRMIEKIKPFILILAPVSMLLCMISILADFYHLVTPITKPEKFECGIRDSDFTVARIVADASQFWGFLIFWYLMEYKAVSAFEGTMFEIKLWIKIYLKSLFIGVVIVTLTYNVFQFAGLDTKNKNGTILFWIYTIISILYNLSILLLYTYKLNELVIADIEKEEIRAMNVDDASKVVKRNNMEDNQKMLLELMTKFAVLLSIQLIAYTIRYIYRSVLTAKNIWNKEQELWLISYTARNIMCVFMVAALYYTFSFSRNEYYCCCKCCHKCCGEVCYFITKRFMISAVKDTIQNKNGDNNLTRNESDIHLTTTTHNQQI